jgi:NAD+ synthetase
MSNLKIALAQINTSIGDLDGNLAKILREFNRAEKENCDLVIFPEMAICGYPCADLWNKKYFILEIEKKIAEICEFSKNKKCAILLGAPTFDFERKKEVLRNSALLIENGEIKKIFNKKSLPNFSVFDEQRYFTASPFISTLEFRGQTLAALICQDLWDSKNLFLLKETIFDCAIIINSSPFDLEKQKQRAEICENFCKTLGKKLIYLNQVGGQDSLVFDGASFVMNASGEIALQMQEFVEDFAVVEVVKDGELNVIEFEEEIKIPLTEALSLKGRGSEFELALTPSPLEGEGWGEGSTLQAKTYNACVLGLHDYITKNGFKKVMLGMSGGIDSALVATMAVDALGAENVELYALPSRFNSSASMNDALLAAKNLGVKLQVISIEKMFEAALETLPNISPLARENIQSRLRGNILMAISNTNGALLLSTGNKSELACGYATIYGDMCGAFNPIKDLYKTQVFALARLKSNVIPENILTKEPTAELRENQKDSDSLPAYEILDKILFALIEEEKSVAEISKNFEEELVKKVAKLFYASEYKRKQAVLGVKISKNAFDLERRYLITNKFTK